MRVYRTEPFDTVCYNGVHAHHTHTHTRQNWIFEEIHQELSAVTCKLDEKQINLGSTLRIMEVLANDLCDQNRRQIE